MAPGFIANCEVSSPRPKAPERAPCRLPAAARRPPAGRSERIRVRLILDRHPLPLREFLPIGGAADSCAVARSAGAAKRDVGLVGDGLVVDMQQSRIKAIADGDRGPTS